VIVLLGLPGVQASFIGLLRDGFDLLRGLSTAAVSHG
jgi:hypothetical protein